MVAACQGEVSPVVSVSFLFDSRVKYQCHYVSFGDV